VMGRVRKGGLGIESGSNAWARFSRSLFPRPKPTSSGTTLVSFLLRIGYRFKPIGGHIRRPCATNGVSTLRGDEESACAHKLDDPQHILQDE
jgi:hypothetical protein